MKQTKCKQRRLTEHARNNTSTETITTKDDIVYVYAVLKGNKVITPRTPPRFSSDSFLLSIL